jgi:hypothetical protein
VGKAYLVEMRVLCDGEEAEILVRVDGQPHVSWKGDPAKLGWAWASEMPTRDYLGFGANQHPKGPEILFADVRLRMISGRAYLLR